MRLTIPGPRDVLTLLPRVLGVLDEVDALVTRIDDTRKAADDLIARIGATVDRFEPSLTALQPTLERLADTTSPQEVDALVDLVDTLPEVSKSMEHDILPILGSLSTVAPDLRELLRVSVELNEMLAHIPGVRRQR
jgi:ABC-type transporter Mla subunit MlaD